MLVYFRHFKMHLIIFSIDLGVSGEPMCLRRACEPVSMLHIYNNLYISLKDIENFKCSLDVDMKNIVLIPFNARQQSYEEDNTSDHTGSFQPSYLAAIYRFDERINKVSLTNDGKKLVFVTRRDTQSRVRLSFLIGCHLIMAHGLGFEETSLAFRPLWELHEHISCSEKSVEKSLRAFCCARCLNWIDFGKSVKALEESKQTIDMEEFEHYSR